MSAYTGILIPADPHAEPTICTPESFEQMKQLMGIDWAQLHLTDIDTYTFWADEEGLLKDQAHINYRATVLALELEGVFHPVVGPVFITGGADEEGRTLPLSEELCQKFMESLAVPSAEALLERVRTVNEQLRQGRS